ncbi:hypothetical protein [Bremerella cremea]|uniref:hypothetical protein n=1 Tax=Bremerella cremea TaxID=1031537 RepID=UPI0031F09329
MKVLKIENNNGKFLDEKNAFHSIDKLTKGNLMWIVERVLDGTAEIEEYDESKLANQAHQVIYKSLYDNLSSLGARKDEFVDKSARLYLEHYERYMDDTSQGAGEVEDEANSTGEP